MKIQFFAFPIDYSDRIFDRRLNACYSYKVPLYKYPLAGEIMSIVPCIQPNLPRDYGRIKWHRATVHLVFSGI